MQRGWALSLARAAEHLLRGQHARDRVRASLEYEAMAERLAADCHPAQRAFVLDPGRRVAAIVGRGGGKTTGGRARLMRRLLLTPRARCVYITKTRSAGEDLLWQPLKTLIERMGIDARWNETKLRVVLPHNGASLRIVGADDKHEIDKLRGQPFHEVHLDETATLGATVVSHLVYRIIGPRLGDYGGCLVMYGTPGQALAGPFYDVTRPASEIGRPWVDRDKPEFDGWLGWSVHQWNLQDAAPHVSAIARLWEEALREKRANGWTDDNPVWRREYLGFWAADDTETVFRYRPHIFGDDASAAGVAEGAAWNQWDPPRDPSTKIAKLPDGDHEWRYVYGMDLGHSDPFALEVFAYSLTDKTLYHVFEYEKRGMYARTIAALLLGEGLDTDEPGGVIGATGWPDAMDADTAGLGGQLLDELRNVYGLDVQAAEKKNKHDAIELFNGDLVDGRIKILKGSVLEQQLQHLQWAVDTAGQLKEDRSARNDCCFVAGTMVRTEAGDVPIEQIRPGLKVWTSTGLRRVRAAWETGARPTWTVTAGSVTLTGTAGHQIPTSNGCKQLARLTPRDTLVGWDASAGSMGRARWSSIVASSTDATPPRRGEISACIGPHSAGGRCIGRSGKTRTGRFLMAFTSITWTAIRSTMRWATSQLLTLRSISASTHASPNALLCLVQPSRSPAFMPPLGTRRPRGAVGTVTTLAEWLRIANGWILSARSAAIDSPPSTRTPRFAVRGATRRSVGTVGSITRSASALSVEQRSSAIGSSAPAVVRRRVDSVEPTGRVELVYNLTVEGEHEYFANGILVKNSDAAIYARRRAAHKFAGEGQAPEPPRPEAGERRRPVVNEPPPPPMHGDGDYSSWLDDGGYYQEAE